MARDNGIPIFPGHPGKGHTTPPSSTSTTTSSTGTPKKKNSGTSSKSGGPTTYAGYLAAQRAEQRKAQRKASKRYLEQAKTLGLQAEALKAALGKHGFRRELRVKLGNVRRAARQQDRLLLRDYRERVGSLEEAAENNEAAADAGTYGNLTNAGRERANALAEVVAQGGGESDVLRAQQMSLRNWEQNQREINQSFTDTLASINSSLTDLTVDTRTARVNNQLNANADKEQLWTNYYDQRSEALTQLGNTYGQMAEYYGLANEQVSSKKVRRKQRRASKRSGEAFMGAADLAGKAWKSPGVSKGIRRWQGASDFEGALNNNLFSQAPTELARPEGATLRRWET